MNATVALSPPRSPDRLWPAPHLSRQRAWPGSRSRCCSPCSAGLPTASFRAMASSGPTLPAVQQTDFDAPLGTPWPQFRGGTERTGYTSDPGPGSDLTLRWSFTVDESVNGIIQSDDNLIAYGADGGLYVLDAGNGEQLWSLDMSSRTSVVQGRVWLPAVAEGTVYVSTQDGVVVALDLETGEVSWQSALADEVSGSPTIWDGTLYVVTAGTDLHALDALTGAEQWASKLPDRISTQSPTVVDGVIYYPGDSGSVNALDASNGTSLWQSEPFSAHRVAAYGDGRLYIPTLDGTLAVVAASDGILIWRTDPLPGEAFNPVVTDEAVILAVFGVSTQSLDPATGEVQWSLNTPALQSSPHAGGSTLYLNFDGEGTYNAVDLQTGEVMATGEAAGAGSTAAIVGDVLFVSGVSGPVRAFGLGGDGAPKEVQGTVPETAYVATPASQTEDESIVQAPAAGEIQAVSVMKISPSGNLGMEEAPDGRFFVMTREGMQFYDRDGNELKLWPLQQGSEPGQFEPEYQGPGINWGSLFAAWLEDGNAYLIDMGNHRVQVFDAEGNYLRSWGTEGTEDGRLIAPAAISATPDGDIS